MFNFIFDLDDTLIAKREIFIHAEQTFIEEMMRLGFEQDVVACTLSEVDMKNIETMGFTPQRISCSMGETYEILCFRNNRIPDPETEEWLKSIGRQIFTVQPRVLEDASEALEILANDGNRLFLWTAGDQKIQERDLATSGLARYFEAVYVFAQKTEKELLHIIQSHNLLPETTWVVGDSIRSDINPALAVGVKAIHIGGPAWEYADVTPIKDSFAKLSSLAELIEFYQRLRFMES